MTLHGFTKQRAMTICAACTNTGPTGDHNHGDHKHAMREGVVTVQGSHAQLEL